MISPPKYRPPPSPNGEAILFAREGALLETLCVPCSCHWCLLSKPNGWSLVLTLSQLLAEHWSLCLQQQVSY